MIYTLAHLIEEAAVRSPEKEAFRCLEESLTYSELDQRSNRVASYLLDSGLMKGDRVGIFMNRCLETTVAIFGILKAGGAYVALNPFMPLSRTREIIGDCGIELLISTSSQSKKMKALLEDTPSLRLVVGLTKEIHPKGVSWEAIFSRPPHPYKPPLIIEQDLAFILYTSGSTGPPKGIMHTHYSGLNLARLEVGLHGLISGDRIGNFAPFHFDQANFGYFAGPLARATTVIFPDSYVRLPQSLAALVAREKITIWFSVPLILIQILQEGGIDKHDFSSLRWVRFGGEVFPVKLLRELMLKWPHVRFINSYGPSELFRCTYYVLDKPPINDEPIPLGRVWGNTEYRILDINDKEVIPGEPGELVVRTATLMAGYWNNRELTERSLFKVKVASGFDHIYYRTGDLVQENKNGELLFLGRNDRQIKFRGYRIEPDEIEATLLKHAGVKEAAVILIRSNDYDKSLEAVVVADAGATLSADDLVRYCKENLPPYSVPAAVTIMEDFPRTSTGKIDRNTIAKLLEAHE